MCKVLQDIGLITEHGSKTLRFQKILDDNKQKTLAFVSYKDGMTIKVYEYTREELEKLQDILCEYLDYKPEVKPKEEPKAETKAEPEKPTGILHSLTTLPSGDVSYQSVLKKATDEEIEEAIEIMVESGGRHQTRIKVCKGELDRRAKRPIGTTESEDKAKAEDKPKAEVKKEEKPRVLVFPTEDKKPQIIPLHTEGERTYGECVVKIQREQEAFKEDAESMYVLDGIRELCKVDQDFRNNFMREEKTYMGFLDYMFNAARSGYCTHFEGDNTRGYLDKDKALGLAIDYYNNDSEKQKAIEDEERKKKQAEAKAKAEANKKGAKNGKVGKKKGRVTA